MTTETKSGKTRQRYPQQYKAESLTLAEKVAAAARQLGFHEKQLYSWRSEACLLQDKSAAEERLLLENVRLKRDNWQCRPRS